MGKAKNIGLDSDYKITCHQHDPSNCKNKRGHRECLNLHTCPDSIMSNSCTVNSRLAAMRNPDALNRKSSLALVKEAPWHMKILLLSILLLVGAMFYLLYWHLFQEHQGHNHGEGDENDVSESITNSLNQPDSISSSMSSVSETETSLLPEQLVASDLKIIKIELT